MEISKTKHKLPEKELMHCITHRPGIRIMAWRNFRDSINLGDSDVYIFGDIWYSRTNHCAFPNIPITSAESSAGAGLDAWANVFVTWTAWSETVSPVAKVTIKAPYINIYSCKKRFNFSCCFSSPSMPPPPAAHCWEIIQESAEWRFEWGREREREERHSAALCWLECGLFFSL